MHVYERPHNHTLLFQIKENLWFEELITYITI